MQTKESGEAKITVYVVITCIVAASGGLLFGFDGGVTGGVSNMPNFLEKFFPEVEIESGNSTSTDPYCRYDSQSLAFFASSMYFAGMIASFPAGVVTRQYGRKVSMTVAGTFFLIGSILLAAAEHYAMLIIGRIFWGIGVGFADQSVTIYNSEMAPPQWRGALHILFQFLTVSGVLIAQLINYGTQHFDWGWRLSLGLAGIPGLILTAGGIFLLETPNSLVERGKVEQARAVLEKIRGTPNVDREMDTIVNASKEAREREERESPWRSLFRKEYLPNLVICVLMPFFQQFTGINAIIFYSPQIFSSLIGSGLSASLLVAIIIGAVQVVATGIGLVLADKFGRKALLVEAAVQAFIAQFLMGLLFYFQFRNSDEMDDWAAILAILLSCGFISAFGWGWGPLGWLVPSEIQPMETRSAGQSITVFVNLACTALIGQTFLPMLCGMKFGVFIFFAGWNLIMSVFAGLCLPETKGIQIDEVQHALHSHKFWKKVMDAEDYFSSYQNIP
eukprot:TRINITY_DN3035_c0_g1_i3.p1 TRINITY_DN3035_c0_g1~~TRINITY_DN3035_c0_g1_i3.p1  ORF type:complete len:504 (+),score=99.45 TRINITY_DN3035_c0_g1_i3:239-1750(+)